MFIFLSGAVANQDYGESKEATLYFRCIEMRLCKKALSILYYYAKTAQESGRNFVSLTDIVFDVFKCVSV